MDIEKIRNLDIFLQEEKEELVTLLLLWKDFKESKSWFYADIIRSYLKMWNSTLEFDHWFPIFEHNLNRQRRAYLRMMKYKISIYPWEYNEKEFEGLKRGTFVVFS